jgi:hypothetical protein
MGTRQVSRLVRESLYISLGESLEQLLPTSSRPVTKPPRENFFWQGGEILSELLDLSPVMLLGK